MFKMVSITILHLLAICFDPTLKLSENVSSAKIKIALIEIIISTTDVCPKGR